MTWDQFVVFLWVIISAWVSVVSGWSNRAPLVWGGRLALNVEVGTVARRRRRRRTALHDSDLGETKGGYYDRDQRKLLEEHLQEILAAQRGSIPGDDDQFPGSPSESGEIPDLNPFKTLMNKNKAGASKRTLSEALSMKDFASRVSKEKGTKRPRGETPPQPNLSRIKAGNGKRGVKPQRRALTPPELSDTSKNDNPQNASSTSKMTLPLSDDEEEEAEEGFYLDPDLYERSRDLMSGDGSLDISNEPTQNGGMDMLSTVDGRNAILERLLQAELAAAKIPQQQQAKTTDGYDENDDWDSIWSLIQEQRSKPFDANQAEEIHREILKNEEGFLNQSKTFQQALIDPEAAERATMERRNQQYRERQERAMKVLLRNMAEFEHELLRKERPTGKSATCCSRCKCQLQERDDDVIPQLWMRQRNLTALCQSCYKVLVQSPPPLPMIPRRKRPQSQSSTSTVRKQQQQQRQGQPGASSIGSKPSPTQPEKARPSPSPLPRKLQPKSTSTVRPPQQQQQRPRAASSISKARPIQPGVTKAAPPRPIPPNVQPKSTSTVRPQQQQRQVPNPRISKPIGKRPSPSLKTGTKPLRPKPGGNQDGRQQARQRPPQPTAASKTHKPPPSKNNNGPGRPTTNKPPPSQAQTSNAAKQPSQRQSTTPKQPPPPFFFGKQSSSPTTPVAKKKSASRPDSWTQLQDPDTGEFFYLDEETGEIHQDLS